jgi:hypothetical protein
MKQTITMRQALINQLDLLRATNCSVNDLYDTTDVCDDIKHIWYKYGKNEHEFNCVKELSYEISEKNTITNFVLQVKLIKYLIKYGCFDKKPNGDVPNEYEREAI